MALWEADQGREGRQYVLLTVHPPSQVTNPQVLKSSNPTIPQSQIAGRGQFAFHRDDPDGPLKYAFSALIDGPPKITLTSLHLTCLHWTALLSALGIVENLLGFAPPSALGFLATKLA